MSQRFAYELITPERAAEMLAHPHPRQRRAGPQKVAAYMRTMADGRWNDHVPQPVMVSPDGLTLNGGHRLTAIVRSGLAQMLLVAYDVPEDVFDVIDVGATRRPQQFVTGARPIQQAICARWLLWAGRRFDQSPSAPALTFDLDEIVTFMDDNRTEIVDAVTATVAAHRSSRVPAGIHAAALILARRAGADPERLGSWIEGVTTGANLSEGDPRLALRERFMMPNRGHVHAGMRVNWYVVVTALNAYLHGREVLHLMPPKLRMWPAAGESPDDYQRRWKTSVNARQKARKRSRKSPSSSPIGAFDTAGRMAASAE